MKSIFLKTSFLLISVFSLQSCAYIIAEAAVPNSCQKCQIINDETGEVVFEEDGCGGDLYNMQQRVKAKAYEEGCGHTVKCEKYKKTESKTDSTSVN